MPGTRIRFDRRPLSELRHRFEEVEEELTELRHERVGLTRWCDLLAAELDAADDAAARERAVRQTLSTNSVFALHGWVPRDAEAQLRDFAKHHELALTIQPPTADDEPPTLLHNPSAVAGSEDLVTFYKTPDYGSWDPSIVAYGSFAVFFAMIVADAGYGLVLTLLTAYLWRRMGKSAGGRRSRNVLATIAGFTVLYGVICGSYFGVSPSDTSLLGHLKILDAQSQSVMMPLTIIIGVLHLSLANAVSAWLARGSTAALAPLGWIAVMFGGTLASMPTFLDMSEMFATIVTRLGTVVLVGGFVAVFLFSSERPLWTWNIKDHLLRIVDGFKGLTGISGLFGDVLSYLRLFALGLSGGKLSATFNDLGSSAWDSAGFGVILAIAIVLLGHTLNLLLSIMSGVVHGLRLNCIEFFKWGLPEEGYPFKHVCKES